MLMQNFFAMGLVAVLGCCGRSGWYSLAVRQLRRDGGWLGDFHKTAFMGHVNGRVFGTIPLVLFMAVKMTFAGAPALMTGHRRSHARQRLGVADRGIWSVRARAGGALGIRGGVARSRGCARLAGGTVVTSSGTCGRVAAILALGVRSG